jgi:hypothetical protein
MAGKENPDFTIDIPLACSVSAGGVEVSQLSISSSEEAYKKSVRLHEEQGHILISSEQIKSEEQFREVVQETSSSFGFTRWNCPWNPKGPKPNWVQPENPSNN